MVELYHIMKSFHQHHPQRTTQLFWLYLTIILNYTTQHNEAHVIHTYLQCLLSAIIINIISRGNRSNAIKYIRINVAMTTVKGYLRSLSNTGRGFAFALIITNTCHAVGGHLQPTKMLQTFCKIFFKFWIKLFCIWIPCKKWIQMSTNLACIASAVLEIGLWNFNVRWNETTKREKLKC